MTEDAGALADAGVQSVAKPAEHDERRAAGTHAEDAATAKAAIRSRWLRILVALSIAFAGAAVWAQLVLAPWLLERIRDGWSWQATFVGLSRQPDAKTGGFFEPTTSLYERKLSIEGQGPDPYTVRMLDDYIIREVATGKIVWRYTLHPLVDRRTGEYAEPAYRGNYLVFPRNVERKVYIIRQNYLEGFPLRFVKEDRIAGLPVYLFEYVGRAEYTASYAGATGYSGIAVAPGQEIKCADDQFKTRMWVEPYTGTTVKIAEGCESGDYVFDIATGKRLEPVLVWWGDTEGTEVVTRAEAVRDRRLRIVVADYLPAGLAGLALVFAVAALVCGRKNA